MTSIQKVLDSNPSWIPDFFPCGFISHSLSKNIIAYVLLLTWSSVLHCTSYTFNVAFFLSLGNSACVICVGVSIVSLVIIGIILIIICVVNTCFASHHTTVITVPSASPSTNYTPNFSMATFSSFTKVTLPASGCLPSPRCLPSPSLPSPALGYLYVPMQLSQRKPFIVVFVTACILFAPIEALDYSGGYCTIVGH